MLKHALNTRTNYKRTTLRLKFVSFAAQNWYLFIVQSVFFWFENAEISITGTFN